MVRRLPMDLKARVVGRYLTCWVAVTRLVLGLGVGVIVGYAVLLMPWQIAVLVALAAVALPGRVKLAALRRAVLPMGQRGRWLMGLLVAAAVACFGWHLLLGAYGVAIVGVDLLLGLPGLLRPTGTEPPAGNGVRSRLPANRVRLTLGPDLPPHPPQRGPAPDGLDDLSPALESAAVPSADEPRLLDQLSDAELRHAWQSSCRALLMVHDPAATERIVAARARYLDAMAQRDPDRFRLWALSSLNATQPLRDGSELDR